MKKSDSHIPLVLPRDADVYIVTILERCKQLVDTGIWEGIHQVRLDSWFNGFASSEERYFGACVLDSLIYRSFAQTQAMVHELFERSIPIVNWRNQHRNPVKVDWLNHLRKDPDDVGRDVVVVPVIRSSDPPTKSGPLVARLIRRTLQINDAHLRWPWQAVGNEVDGAKAIIFVDDFVGTGRQFSRFVSDFSLGEVLKSKYCVYAPLVMHEKGMGNIRTKFPEIEIAAAEILTSEIDLFDQKSMIFSDGVNTPSVARDFHRSILKRIGFQNSSLARGFGRLGLAYSFQHATPNNSIPLLWWSGSDWKPLFDR